MLVFLSVSWRPRPHEQGSARCGGTSLFLMWWVVWNGRYLDLFYCLLIKCFRTILFFFLFCLVFVCFTCSCLLNLLYTYLVPYLDEKNDDEDDDDKNISGRSGLNLPVWSRIAIT